MDKLLLSQPKHGWTYFELGTKTYGLSYLTDIPTQWLRAAIYGLENMAPFVVKGFCEPGRLLCLVSYWNCHVMLEDDEDRPLQPDEVEHETVHINMISFCKMLYASMDRYLDDWSEWDADFYDDEPSQVAARKKEEIRLLLERLSALIQEKEELFGGGYCFF